MTEQKSQTIASARLMLLTIWRKSGCNATDFTEKIENGEVICAAKAVIKKFSAPTLFRWEQLYKAGGVENLKPAFRQKTGAGSRALSQKQKDLLQAFYLRQQRPQLSKAVEDIQKLYNIEIPYQTALRYIRELPQPLVTKYRYGGTRLNDRELPYVERDYTLYDSMSMVTSDHHHLDMYVFDDEAFDEHNIFRPWITVFQDIRSRKILGWYLSKNPNGYTILQALKQVVDKYGCPQQVHIDNGKDYRSKALNGKAEKITVRQDGLEEERQILIAGIFHDIGCDVSFAQPYHGQSKPVERWFREVAEGFCKKYDTYCGSNTVERPEDAKLYFSNIKKMGKRKVEVSFSRVKEQIGNWIVDWNACHKHRGQGMNMQTPDAVFESNWKLIRKLPKEKYDIVFSQTELKSVNRSTITWDNLSFTDGSLGTYNGRKILVRRPLEDISKVYCTTVDGTFICQIQSGKLRDTKITVQALRDMKKEQRKLKADIEKVSRIASSGVNVSDAYDLLLNKERMEEAIKKPSKTEYVAEHLSVAPVIKMPVAYEELQKDQKKKQLIIGLLD